MEFRGERRKSKRESLSVADIIGTSGIVKLRKLHGDRLDQVLKQLGDPEMAIETSRATYIDVIAAYQKARSVLGPRKLGALQNIKNVGINAGDISERWQDALTHK